MMPSSGQNGLSRFERRSVRLPLRISSAIGGRSTGTSSRTPRKTGARSRPSRVRSAKVTSAASAGSTQVTSAARTRGMRGVATSGDVGRDSGRSSGQQRLDVSVADARPHVAGPVEPVRLPPAEDERAELRPTPRPPREPDDRKVVLRRSLSFCHSGVRRPGRYGASARFATTPSRPCADAASSSAGPSSNAGDRRTASDAGSRTSSRSRLRSSSGRRYTGSPSSTSRSKTIRTSRPEPDCSDSKRAAPDSSSAQTSPSSTADGVRTACTTARATSRKRSERSLPFRLVSVATPPRSATRAR